VKGYVIMTLTSSDFRQYVLENLEPIYKRALQAYWGSTSVWDKARYAFGEWQFCGRNKTVFFEYLADKQILGTTINTKLAHINMVEFARGNPQPFDTVHGPWTKDLLFKVGIRKMNPTGGRHGMLTAVPSMDLLLELVQCWDMALERKDLLLIEEYFYVLSAICFIGRPNEWATLRMWNAAWSSETYTLYLGTTKVAPFNTKNVGNYYVDVTNQHESMKIVEERTGHVNVITLVLRTLNLWRDRGYDFLFPTVRKDTVEATRRVFWRHGLRLTEPMQTNFLRKVGVSYMAYGNVPVGRTEVLGGWSSNTREERYQKRLVAFDAAVDHTALLCLWGFTYNFGLIWRMLQPFNIKGYYLARYAKSYPEIGGCKSFNNDEKGSNHKKALTSSRPVNTADPTRRESDLSRPSNFGSFNIERKGKSFVKEDKQTVNESVKDPLEELTTLNQRLGALMSERIGEGSNVARASTLTPSPMIGQSMKTGSRAIEVRRETTNTGETNPVSRKEVVAITPNWKGVVGIETGETYANSVASTIQDVVRREEPEVFKVSNDVHAVNNVMEFKQKGKKHPKYLFRVLWVKGDETWEPHTNIHPRDIRDFIKEHPDIELPDLVGHYADQLEEEDEGEHTIERIMDHRVSKRGKRKYLVRWSGYTSADDTWEDLSSRNDELIASYLEQCTRR
jgi:hypothetical protein